MPTHDETSKPARPLSWKVGTSGSALERLALGTPSASSPQSRTYRRAVAMRVAVGLGLRRDLAADVAARAGAVLDHHLLAKARAERLGDHARGVVRDATRREGHDDTHRPRRPFLRRRRADYNR